MIRLRFLFLKHLFNSKPIIKMRKGVSCWIKSYEGVLKGIESPFSEAEAQANMVMALTVVTASSRASASVHYLSEKLSESFTFNGDVKKCKTANTQQKHPRANYILKEKHRLKTIIIMSWKINWDPNLKCSRPPPLIFSLCNPWAHTNTQKGITTTASAHT